MKKQIIALVVGSMLASPGWTAEKNRAAKEESIGLGSGAAIGAIAGGPIGFVSAPPSAAGSATVSTTSAASARPQTSARATPRCTPRVSSASLRATSLSSRPRNRSCAASASHTAKISSKRCPSRCTSGTEDTVLGTGTEQRISQLAQLVGGMDGAVIRLDGHTDARGTRSTTTSCRRRGRESVRDALIRGGMPGDRIVVTASGELGSSATEQDVDGMALDRRVQNRDRHGRRREPSRADAVGHRRRNDGPRGRGSPRAVAAPGRRFCGIDSRSAAPTAAHTDRLEGFSISRSLPRIPALP